MEVLNQYPVRKIIVEFTDDGIYANGRKYRDIYELIQWVKDSELVFRTYIHSSHVSSNL